MKRLRRTYVIDRKLQLSVAAHLLGALAGVAALYVVGMLLLSGGGGSDGLSAGEVLRANLIYFLLAAAILAVVVILITHRIAGPALVVERAVRGMKTGDHSLRLDLRKRDYLKPLAAAVAELREDLDRRAQAGGELKAALDRGDLDAARTLVERVVPGPVREPETAAR
jgi:methyl-accepting chemotaxis protein